MDTLDEYLQVIEHERESRPSEARLADELVRLRAVNEGLRGENEELRGAVGAFLAWADSHVEGPIVDDSYVKGRICADEDCQRYWPCPVEELRRAIGA